jgi:hypothetical protein
MAKIPREAPRDPDTSVSWRLSWWLPRQHQGNRPVTQAVSFTSTADAERELRRIHRTHGDTAAVCDPPEYMSKSEREECWGAVQASLLSARSLRARPPS